uniref:solute carrier family 25 member 34-like isoform X1 n=1 Tax=Myxine glutinosa TaxID=7769 RepID=UPI00358F1242
MNTQTAKPPLWKDVLSGGLAGCGACLVSNPLEVVKTRMQLQGELQSKKTHPVHYKNAFQALWVLLRTEGPRSLQAGLVPALFYQMVMNGVRLGTYSRVQAAGFTDSAFGSAIAACASGLAGAALASPFYLVKTQLQVQTSSSIAVGFQHNHMGMVSALTGIRRREGLKGLWRGVEAAGLRVAVGSTAQLTTFTRCKELAVRAGLAKQGTLWQILIGCLLSSVALAICMTPFDVISTRLYNQPTTPDGKGRLYSGVLDCLRRTVLSEGPLALYKGIGPAYLRMGPHTILSLLLWDVFRGVLV